MNRLALTLLAFALIGCTSNMTMNMIDVSKSDKHQIPRFEVSGQGSAGDASAPPQSNLHVLERTTAGGSYVRRQDPVSAQHRMTAGVHE